MLAESPGSAKDLMSPNVDRISGVIDQGGVIRDRAKISLAAVAMFAAVGVTAPPAAAESGSSTAQANVETAAARVVVGCYFTANSPG